jgi:hypothetical protein
MEIDFVSGSVAYSTVTLLWAEATQFIIISIYTCDELPKYIKQRQQSCNSRHHMVINNSRIFVKVSLVSTLHLLSVWDSCFLIGSEVKVKVALTLREEHGLRVFENGVLRRIFGPKREEVTGSWRKLYNEELHYLYSLPILLR